MSSDRIAVIGGLVHPLYLTPILWIDAADASTITTGAGGITNAADKSGNGYDLPQVTSGNRPDYSGSLNGRNIITFAGGPDHLRRVTGTSVGKNAPGLTAYIVWNHTSSPTGGRQNILVVGTASGTRFALYGGLTSNKLSVVARRLDADAITTLTGSANLGTSWHFATVVVDCVAGTIDSWLDGASDGSASLPSSGGNSSNTDTNIVTISSGNASFDLVGGFAEMIIYNAAHSALERKRVQGYLRNKWAL